jgi:hypothetical protein
MEIFETWRDEVSKNEREASKREKELRTSINKKDPVEYARNMSLFQGGLTNALGPEYYEAYSAREQARTELSAAGEILSWLEANETMGRPAASYDEINKMALYIAECRGWYAVFAYATLAYAYTPGRIPAASPKSGNGGGRTTFVDPADLRWTQTTAGGGGRAAAYRKIIAEEGYVFGPIDVVKTADGLVTLDHTRAALALEAGITRIPANIHLATDLLPESMLGRFGPSTTWGEAAAYRASMQRPPLPPTGTTTPPKLPR